MASLLDTTINGTLGVSAASSLKNTSIDGTLSVSNIALSSGESITGLLAYYNNNSTNTLKSLGWNLSQFEISNGNLSIKTGVYQPAGSYASSNLTGDLSITSGTSQTPVELSANTVYKLTAGGNTIYFKTPEDNIGESFDPSDYALKTEIPVTDVTVGGSSVLDGTIAKIPTLFSGDYNDLTNKPTLATVATSGSYNDLSNKPTLFSGNYNDLTNKPTIPTVPTHRLLQFDKNGGYGSVTQYDPVGAANVTISYDTIGAQKEITNSNKLSASLIDGLAAVATGGTLSFDKITGGPTLFKLKESVATLTERDALTDMEHGDVVYVKSKKCEYIWLEDETTHVGSWEEFGPNIDTTVFALKSEIPTVPTYTFRNLTFSTSGDGDVGPYDPVGNANVKISYNSIGAQPAGSYASSTHNHDGVYQPVGNYLTSQTQVDWNQTNNSAVDYIKNKPTIPAAQIQSDWNQTTTTALDYIKNKPSFSLSINERSNQMGTIEDIILNPDIIYTMNSSGSTLDFKIDMDTYLGQKGLDPGEGSFITSLDLDPNTVITSSSISSFLADYETIEHAQNNYVSNGQFSTTLADYVTTENLSDAISNAGTDFSNTSWTSGNVNSWLTGIVIADILNPVIFDNKLLTLEFQVDYNGVWYEIGLLTLGPGSDLVRNNGIVAFRTSSCIIPDVSSGYIYIEYDVDNQKFSVKRSTTTIALNGIRYRIIR